MTFTLSAGAGDDWKPVAQVTVPARGSAFHVLPADVAGDWVRVAVDRDALGVTAVFRYGIRGGAAEDPGLFAAVADVGSSKPWIGGVIRSGSGQALPLDVLATDVDATGKPAAARAWQVAVGAPPVAVADDDPFATFLREKAKRPMSPAGPRPHSPIAREP